MNRLSTKQAATYLSENGYQLSLRGLRARRQRNAPPEFIKLGTRVVYEKSSLDSFLKIKG